MVNLEDLKKEAKRILEEGKVKYIIGYVKSTATNLAAPAFIKKPEDTDKLIWDPTCIHNLTKFLVDEKRRKAREREPDTRPIGIIVKGCDSRAINVLLQEKFIQREDVFILGLSCEATGVIDEAKIKEKLKGKKIQQIEFDSKQNLSIHTDNGEVKIPIQDVLAERCRECQASSPLIYDTLLGDKNTKKAEEPFKSLEEIESMPQKERWEFWQEQLGKCIRCYACRSVCPMCYCDECVVDTINFAITADTSAEEKSQKIKWIEKSPVSSENFGYHLTRAIHLAGRCIDCGECERVCPVEIPLRFLNKKLEKAAKDLYGYDVGFDPDQPSLIACFKDEDPEDFIR